MTPDQRFSVIILLLGALLSGLGFISRSLWHLAKATVVRDTLVQSRLQVVEEKENEWRSQILGLGNLMAENHKQLTSIIVRHDAQIARLDERTKRIS